MLAFALGVEAGSEGAGFVMAMAALGVGYGGLRAWFRARVRRKSRTLTRLLDRLTDLVRDYDTPALPGRRPSRTAETSDSR